MWRHVKGQLGLTRAWAKPRCSDGAKGMQERAKTALLNLFLLSLFPASEPYFDS